MTVTVNDQKIDNALIEYEVQRLRPEYEKVFSDMPKEERENQLLQWSKENVIERTLIAQQAEKENLEIPDEQIDSHFNQIKNDPKAHSEIVKTFNIKDDKHLKKYIELELKVQKLQEKICKNGGDISDEQIKQHYEQNKNNFAVPERIRVAHIVKHTGFDTDEAEAQKIMIQVKEQIEKGTPFEVLARQYSDCPDNAGDLGNITPGQMVEEFDDVVFNLGTGQVSDVFRTRFGFHIAKVYQRTPASYRSIDEVRDQIIKELTEQNRQELLENYIDDLKSKADIIEN
jgi:parvulin-like peptidyl-prolyl isomerase